MGHASSGAPFCCANGEDVKILTWNRKHEFCIVGMANNDLAIRAWRPDGTYSNINSRDFKLVMTPFGFIEGKPVFVGDVVEVLNGRDSIYEELNFPVSLGAELAAMPKKFRWPAPAKVYLETTISPDYLRAEYNSQIGGIGPSLIAVANAALRHAIESKQVILPFDGMLAHKGHELYGAIENVGYFQRVIVEQEQKLDRAQRTLELAGYTDCGGELWKPPVGNLYQQRFGRVERPRAEAEQRVVRDWAVATAVRNACAKPFMAPHIMNNFSFSSIMRTDIAAAIDEATGQPSPPAITPIEAANAMLLACHDVLEQFNDRHMVKRSDVVAAARMVMEHIDVNKVLAGVKS